MKKNVMFISSTGAHLSELLQLANLFPRYNSCLITKNTKSNRKLKKKYNNVFLYQIYLKVKEIKM